MLHANYVELFVAPAIAQSMDGPHVLTGLCRARPDCRVGEETCTTPINAATSVTPCIGQTARVVLSTPPPARTRLLEVCAPLVPPKGRPQRSCAAPLPPPTRPRPFLGPTLKLCWLFAPTRSCGMSVAVGKVVPHDITVADLRLPAESARTVDRGTSLASRQRSEVGTSPLTCCT